MVTASGGQPEAGETEKLMVGSGATLMVWEVVEVQPFLVTVRVTVFGPGVL